MPYFDYNTRKPITDKKCLEILAHHHNTLNDNAIDYIRDDGPFGSVAFCGGRPSQEDNLAYGNIPKNIISQQGSMELAEKLYATVKTIGKTWEQQRKTLQEKLPEDKRADFDPGSTLSVTVAKGDTLVTATLGDAMSYLALYDKTGKLRGVRRLNKIYHTPEKELVRIKSVYGIVLFGRVGGTLNISRSLGDITARPFVIDAPSIEINSIKEIAEEFNLGKSTFGSAKLITCCDGITDGVRGKFDRTKNILQSKDELLIQNCIKTFNASSQAHTIGTYLVGRAYRKSPTKDNTSVVIQDLKPATLSFQGVFDGHGGADASYYLARQFQPSLFACLKQSRKSIQALNDCFKESLINETEQFIRTLDDVSAKYSAGKTLKYDHEKFKKHLNAFEITDRRAFSDNDLRQGGRLKFIHECNKSNRKSQAANSDNTVNSQLKLT